MADNTVLNSGTGGDTISTDDIAGVKVQRVKVQYGVDGAATDVSDTNPLPVDDAGGSLTVDNGGTFAVQVDAALPAGTNAIGKLSANSGVDIGDVDVLSLPSTVHSADFDTGAGTDTTLAFGIAVPASGGAAVVPGDATAGLKVDLGADNDVVVTNAGTFAVQVDGNALTALQLIDDVVFADDAAFTLGTSKGVMIMGFAGTQSVDANDAAALACDTDGALHISDGGNTITVDNGGTFAVQAAQSGTWTLGANSGVDIGDVTINNASGAAAVNIQDGGNSITVDGSVSLAAAIPAGTNNIGDVDVLSVVPGTSATSLGKAEDAAHTTGDTGVMALAVRNDDLDALAGADGDYAPLQVTQNGALLICPSANDDYKYAIIDAATSGDNTLVAAVASRKIRVLAAFMVSAGTVNARFESGASGTALTGQMNLVANSGFTLPFNPAGWFETAATTLLNLELSAAVSVDGCLTYIEVP